MQPRSCCSSKWCIDRRRCLGRLGCGPRRGPSEPRRGPSERPLTLGDDGEQFLRAYIAQAHRYQPYIPATLSDYIETSYVSMRNDEQDSAVSVWGACVVCVRARQQVLARRGAAALCAPPSRHGTLEACSSAGTRTCLNSLWRG